MIKKLTTLYLPEGTYQNVPVDVFDASDLPILKNIYNQWRGLSSNSV